MSLPPPMAPGSGDPYGAVPGPPPPAKSNKTLFIVLGVVGVVLLLCCCGGGVLWAVLRNKDDNSSLNDPPTPRPSTTSYNTVVPGLPDSSSSSSAASNGKVGTTIKQGNLEVTVTAKPRCGQKTVGSGYSTADADGQFCLIDLKFHNVGTTAIKPVDYRNKLIDTAGGETTQEILATWYANPGKTTKERNKLFENIYPGATVVGIIVFDLPIGQTPSSLFMNPAGTYDDPGITIDLR